MAFNTPYKMWSGRIHGGTCDPASCRGRPGFGREEDRDQYHHAIDLVPTVLDVLGLESPNRSRARAESLRGVSMRYSFDRRRAEPRKRSSIQCWLTGHLARGLEGDHHASHDRRLEHFNDDEWELYTPTSTEPSCTTSQRTARQASRARSILWYAKPARTRLPLDDRGPLEIILTPRPVLSPAAQPLRCTSPTRLRFPESQTVNVRNRSYAIGRSSTFPRRCRRRDLRPRVREFGRFTPVRRGQPACAPLQLRGIFR